MRLSALMLLLPLALPISLAGPSWGETGAGRADLVMFNGVVLTVDQRFSVAQAVAVKDGRILAVGTNRAVLRLAGKTTKRINLKGRTVIPGLIDSHIHMLSTAQELKKVQLGQVRSMAELAQAIAERVKVTPPGQWVEASGSWHHSQLAEKRFPNKSDLDPVSPNHPVFIARGGHTAIVNSYALKMAGVTRDTPDPTGGKIIKDAAGEPLGLFVGRPARALVERLVPQPTHQDKVALLEEVVGLFNRAGITSVREALITPEDMRVYQELWAQGKLTVRTRLLWDIVPQRPLPQILADINAWGVVSGFGDDFLRIGGIKIFADGGVETAFLREPYKGRPDYRGLQFVPTDKLREIVKAANRNRWQVSIHAVGGAAMDLVLDLFEEADKDRPIADRRWTIEHGWMPDDRTFQRMKRLGVTVTSQTPHIYVLGSSILEEWGPERSRYVLPNRDWISNGVVVGGGTDSPITPYNQFFAMWVDVTRNTMLVGPMSPDQKVTREEALRMHTINSAYIAGEERLKGSIEPGKLADLVVLSKDFLKVPEEEIKEIEPLLTMVGGRIVFRSGI